MPVIAKSAESNAERVPPAQGENATKPIQIDQQAETAFCKNNYPTRAIVDIGLDDEH